MKSTKLINKKSFAFTLAEVVVVMAILGVMMAAFAPVVTKRSLSTHENSRLWQRTDDFKGIYFGTAHDTKKVLIGETTIPDSGKYFHPKLTITSTLIDPENDTKRVTPQIAFRIKDHNNSGPRNAGYLFMTASKSANNQSDNTGTVVLGGVVNSTYNQYDEDFISSNLFDNHITAIGINACRYELQASKVYNTTNQKLNTVCIGPRTGRAYLALQDQGPAEIFIGASNIDYSADHIFFGANSLKQLTSTTPSDIRLKNLGKEFEGGLDELDKLTIYNYTYKRDSNKEPQVGVIAQDLQKVLPKSVKENSDGYLYIKKDHIFFAAVNAIKELHQKITNNNEKIKALEERNAILEQQNKELQELYIELSKRVDNLDKKKSKGKLTIIPTKIDEEAADSEFTVVSESTQNSEE